MNKKGKKIIEKNEISKLVSFILNGIIKKILLKEEERIY